MKMDKKTSKNVFHNILLYCVMGFYLLILFVLLFHKKSAGSFQSFNFVPFRTIRDYLFGNDIIVQSFALSNVLGNVAMFIPLGIYTMLISRKKSMMLSISLIALFSVAAEIFQFIFKVGATDIDDVILNTIGGLIGVMLYKVIHFIFKGKTRLAIELLAPVGGVLAFVILIIINQ